MKPMPDEPPRCSCMTVTRWLYDFLYNDWTPARCWRCLEIASMKVGHSDPLLYSLLPWDTDTCDRFIELVLSDTHLLPRHEARAVAMVHDTSRDKWKVGT